MAWRLQRNRRMARRVARNLHGRASKNLVAFRLSHRRSMSRLNGKRHLFFALGGRVPVRAK